MIKITHEFATVQDAISHLRLHGADTMEVLRPQTPLVPPPVVAIADPMPELASDVLPGVTAPEDPKVGTDIPETGKRGRKPRADRGAKRGPNKRTAGAADFATPDGTDQPDPPAPSGEVTLDDVKAALQKVYDAQPNDEKAMEVCRGILSRKGVQKLRDLPAEQYAGIVRIANEVLEGGAV